MVAPRLEVQHMVMIPVMLTAEPAASAAIQQYAANAKAACNRMLQSCAGLVLL
jgi:hypothetical protein